MHQTTDGHQGRTVGVGAQGRVARRQPSVGGGVQRDVYGGPGLPERALRILDGLRYRPAAEARQLPPAIADALVATARVDRDRDAVPIARGLEDAHGAFTQILDCIDALPFNADELAQTAAALQDARAHPTALAAQPTHSAKSLGTTELRLAQLSANRGDDRESEMWYQRALASFDSATRRFAERGATTRAPIAPDDIEAPVGYPVLRQILVGYATVLRRRGAHVEAEALERRESKLSTN